MGWITTFAILVSTTNSTPTFSWPTIALVNEAQIHRAFEMELRKEIESRTKEQRKNAAILRSQMKDWTVALRHGSPPREPDRYEQAILENERRAERIEKEVETLKAQIEQTFRKNLTKRIRKTALGYANESGAMLVHFHKADVFEKENASRQLSLPFIDATQPIVRRLREE